MEQKTDRQKERKGEHCDRASTDVDGVVSYRWEEKNAKHKT